jgi:hypothetical protein
MQQLVFDTNFYLKNLHFTVGFMSMGILALVRKAADEIITVSLNSLE